MHLLGRRLFNIGRHITRTNRTFFYCDLPHKLPAKKQPKASVERSPHIKYDPKQIARTIQSDGKDDSDDDDEEDDRPGFVPDYDDRFMSQFDTIREKNRETFIELIRVYRARDTHRRYNVEFIYAALKQMREFGVERDVDVYKALLNVMPQGKYVATNAILADFVYYPKHQYCIIYLLDQMEYNALIPDLEVHDTVIRIFGPRSHPLYKLWRMNYWMPKFKNLSPWLLPDPVPDESLQLAKLAIRQMCTVDVESAIDVLDTSQVTDAIDKTWIVSGQSPEQKKLLRRHPPANALRIEGPHFIWLRNRSLDYFTLTGEAEPDEHFEQATDPDDVRDIPTPDFLQFAGTRRDVATIKPKRSIHQQDDGTVYAICATGTSSKDSLLSWIRLLQERGNPTLGNMPVLFKFRSTAATEENALATIDTKRKL